MVASSQPLATQAGLRILESGGNAVDAAIAVNACLGLMEPTGCGIGGDLFAIGWDAAGSGIYGLNASGPSARGAGLGDILCVLEGSGERAIPNLGPLSVSLPGCVAGWNALHARYGCLSLEEILQPAIAYAENGFPVSELIAFYWKASLPAREGFSGFAETFTLNGKRAPAKGETWRNRALAETYRQLAGEGAGIFYRGKIARTMAAFLEENGSFLRLADFEAFAPEWVDPVSIRYRGHEIWELPPNGQGLAALQILAILEGFDVSGMGFASADYAHLFTEAKKLAFADRARSYADPAFHETPLKTLLSEAYTKRQRERFSMEKAARSIHPDPEILRHGDTVYLCTADCEGNIVSLIQSNFWGMGSGLCPPGLGFGFQNRGTAFALTEDHANVYAPGKRPFHTIIPAFVTRGGEPVCAFGVMGGDAQPQAHAQVICNLLDFGMNLQEAGDAPRMLHSGDSEPTGARMSDGGALALESGFPWPVVRELMQRGHRISWDFGGYGGYQAIWRDPHSGIYSGASESRKDGQAAGY